MKRKLLLILGSLLLFTSILAKNNINEIAGQGDDPNGDKPAITQSHK